MKKKRILLLLLLSMLVIVIYNIILNNMVEVVYTNVEIESLPEEFQDFKILQLTDLHNKIFMNDQKYLIYKINSIDYDILVITGDMSDYNDIEKSDGFIKLLDGINNKNNIFYVDGNVGLIAIDDTNNKVTEIGEQLINKGCILLDKPYVIERNGQKLVLSQFLNKETYEKQYPETKDEDIKMVLTHYPRDRRYYEEVSVGNLPDYDLVIAGHYHGGQYRIPFLGAIFIPNTNPYGTRFFPKQEEVSGLTEWGGYKQYISRGLGASGDYKILRFRLFNIPQIDVLILKNKE